MCVKVQGRSPDIHLLKHHQIKESHSHREWRPVGGGNISIENVSCVRTASQNCKFDKETCAATACKMLFG